jgi:phenylacetate-CoA ligase
MPPAGAFPKRLALVTGQLDQLNALLPALAGRNSFYTCKLAEVHLPYKIPDLEVFSELVPFTTKPELAEDQRTTPPYGTNLTYAPDRYTRCHQTSGSTGAPLRWLDTTESWERMLQSWERVHRIGGTTGADRIFFSFSFGPFLGFWTAFESAVRMGCLCLPGGGMSSAARLRAILEHRATVLCCTPSYALHLAEVARAEKIDLAQSSVRLLNVAGEPGGSIPATRARLEQLWPGARVYDHHGMTETGPVTYECPARPGVLHVMEDAFVAEVIDPASGRAVAPGAIGELVLTTLARAGSPLLRYRTGDLVRPAVETACECGRHELALEGGILGRTDDMVVVRGVNIYPGAVEEIIRGGGGAEYQVNISTARALTEISVRVEAGPGAEAGGLAEKLEKLFEAALTLRVPVTLVAAGSLPRFEGKARRWVKTAA